MSEIAEIRKLFQDLIAPDVKSIATDLAAFKINVDHQFKALKESVETKFDDLEAIEHARYLAVIAKIEVIRMEFASTEAIHAARHEALEKRLCSEQAIQTTRHEALEKRLSSEQAIQTARHEALEKRLSSEEAIQTARHEALEKRLSSEEAIQTVHHEAILKALDIDKRLERVEARQASGTAA